MRAFDIQICKTAVIHSGGMIGLPKVGSTTGLIAYMYPDAADIKTGK